jgi:phage gpG-like protein
MTLDEFSIQIEDLRRASDKFTGADALDYAANTAVEKFKENFENEGFFGSEWQQVQRRIPGTKAYKSVVNRHPADTVSKILTRTGDLKNSINYRVEADRAIIESDTTYGKFHNEGDGKIPQRRFIGDDPKLSEAIKEKLEQELDKIMKK